ncbi:MAG: flagellar M-ring protein FliF [Epsilonproteobacteria bacterium]|nr:flagellar M-ring protein FliF [Campylobacterota bacterium]NPA56897.1 flagellar M-ring protein FliF [Campylobacterota bacterium]
MALDLNSLKERAGRLLSSKDFAKTLFLALGIITIILLLVAILLRDINERKYGVLYTNLSPEDAGKILTVLQEERIPYKIEGQGSIILVPKEKIYDVRLKLAAKGLPSSQTVGFELFNEPKMGATHFQENINYIRAIEGELARTIKRIDAIKDAKVNVAMPQDSIFAREEDETKASVVISLWPGRDLTKEQVKAIVFLVSHAVPKLKPENVTVVDNRGRVLSDLIEEQEEEVKDIVDIKRKLKREIEKSVQSMLARALGPQRVVVRANVDIEMAKIAKEDRFVDPERVAVLSERKIQEKMRGFQRDQGGAPGTPTNVPATINRGNRNLVKESSKKDTTTNYDISKSLIRTEQNLFKIKRLTVGVLIDGRYETKIDGNGTKEVVFKPRSKEELQAYEDLIKSAVGFDPERGDKVTVISVPFETTRETMMASQSGESQTERYLLYGGIGLLTLILAGLGGALLMRSKRARQKEQEEEMEALRGVAALNQAAQTAHAAHEKEIEEFHIDQEPTYKKLLEIIDENPDIVANMLSKWMKEEGR